MKHYLKTLLLICSFWIAGCAPSDNGSAIGREFYSGSLDEKSMGERIATYSIPDQWEIYFFAKTVVHPPDFTLS